MASKNEQYKVNIEHRMTKLEERISAIADDITELKDNHIKHLADDVAEIRGQMRWGIGIAITTLISIVIDLGVRLMSV